MSGLGGMFPVFSLHRGPVTVAGGRALAGNAWQTANEQFNGGL